MGNDDTIRAGSIRVHRPAGQPSLLATRRAEAQKEFTLSG